MAYQSFTPASWEHFKDVLPQKIWKHVDLTTNTTAGLLALISGYDTVSVYIGTAFEFKSGTTNADKWLFAAAQTVNFWRTGTNSFRAIARVTFSKANSDAYITKDMLITTSAAAINCAELYGDGMKYATLSNVISALSTNGIRGAAGDVNVFRVTQESTITYNNETYTVPAYTYITAACCPLTTGSSPEGTWIASPIYATDSEGTPCILFLDANGVRQVMKGASEHYKKTFVGTQADWDLLSVTEKKQYDLADFTDDTASGVPIISDTVTAGDMNPVTSNAVAQAIALPKYLEVHALSQEDLEANFKTLFPEGVYLAFWYKAGRHEVLIIQNTDPDYYSYIWFGYGQALIQRSHNGQMGWVTLGTLSS